MAPGIGPAFEFNGRSEFVLDLEDTGVEEAKQPLGALRPILEVQADLDMPVSTVGPNLVMHTRMAVAELEVFGAGANLEVAQRVGKRLTECLGDIVEKVAPGELVRLLSS